MAQNLNVAKRRISSINATKKITNAMELFASVKLSKYKSPFLKNRDYINEMENLINLLFKHKSNNEDCLYQLENSANKDLYVVITSNLGLCASFNNDIFKFVEENVTSESSDLLIIGQKGHAHYLKEKYNLLLDYVSLNEKIVYEDISKFSRYLTNLFINGKYKNINLVYTHYVNSIKFVPSTFKLFPLSNEIQSSADIGYEPIFDPNVKTLIEDIVPIYINAVIYSKIVESTVCEQASRRNAMDNANENADELINKLTIEYNKARQAAITQEISEVVSGSTNK